MGSCPAALPGSPAALSPPPSANMKLIVGIGGREAEVGGREAALEWTLGHREAWAPGSLRGGGSPVVRGPGSAATPGASLVCGLCCPLLTLLGSLDRGPQGTELIEHWGRSPGPGPSWANTVPCATPALCSERGSHCLARLASALGEDSRQATVPILCPVFPFPSSCTWPQTRWPRDAHKPTAPFGVWSELLVFLWRVMTNGGKTTLANGLHRSLPNCCVIHQDDFFKVALLAREDGREPGPAPPHSAAQGPRRPHTGASPAQPPGGSGLRAREGGLSTRPCSGSPRRPTESGGQVQPGPRGSATHP
ncbi:Hypothetical predicted protein [Marmota monax]|uniref:Uncharacterized protein n=1 Tax=Marmota monax TaxID=9995 RepID=A0A5E4BXS9_MARMO|nr:Hypothetical predicted protein [Marmota monax]